MVQIVLKNGRKQYEETENERAHFPAPQTGHGSNYFSGKLHLPEHTLQRANIACTWKFRQHLLEKQECLMKPLFYSNVKNIFWMVRCIILNEALTNESCWSTRVLLQNLG
jgi:hypothetical protein